jgi:hypothetical protein
LEVNAETIANAIVAAPKLKVKRQVNGFEKTLNHFPLSNFLPKG